MTMSDEKYKLSTAEHEAVLQVIYDDMFGDKQPSERPVAYILGGQPGCGKSTLIERSLKSITHGAAVIINGDEFRHYHPYAEEIFAADPERFADLTDLDVRDWTRSVFEKAVNDGYNIIFEGTMRTNQICGTIRNLQSRGYNVNILVLAVPELESRLSIYGRYEEQYLRAANPRFTKTAAHDEAYAGMLSTLQQIESEKLYSSLSVFSRDGSVVFHADKNCPSTGVVAAIENFRNKVWSQTHYEEYVDHAEKIVAKIKARNGQSEYIDGIRELEQRAEAQKKSLNSRELSSLMSGLMMYKKRQK